MLYREKERRIPDVSEYNMTGLYSRMTMYEMQNGINIVAAYRKRYGNG